MAVKKNPREQQDGGHVLLVSRWILAVPTAWDDVSLIIILRLLVCSAHVHQLPILDEDKRIWYFLINLIFGIYDT